MRDIRRSFGGTVIFAYIAIEILAGLADLLIADWRLHLLAWNDVVPIALNGIICATLIAAICIPFRHPPPRLFVSLMLLTSIVWKVYGTYSAWKGGKMFSISSLMPMFLYTLTAIAMAMPISHQMSEATPFYEARWDDEETIIS